MITDFKTSFLRSIKKIVDSSLKEEVERIILSVEEAKTMEGFPELKKMKGCRNRTSYRIKLDSYRIGITITNDVVTFVVFGHRKDIYKSFP